MKRIRDRFVVEAPLGAGGMGRIFRGRDEQTGQAVAIKILKRAHLEDPVVRERFRREALGLRQICHPGVVSVLDFGETEEGDPYTVLPLLPGETLESLLQRSGRLRVSVAIPIVDAILAALEACHAVGIVHRDVKPANVIVASELDAELAVTLIDFGLAHVGGASIEKLTETGVVQGTPAYMPPEQCRGEEVGPAADVYATAVVAYEILAGGAPFAGADAATVMAQHLFVEPRPLAVVAPDVPAGIERAIQAALAKRPEDRPSASAFRAALAAVAAGTDPATRAAAATALRQETLGLPRSLRVLPGRGVAPIPSRPAGSDGAVAIWVDDRARATALQTCLAAAGVAPLTLAPAEGDALVIVSAAAADGLDRLRALRERHPKLPVIVAGIRGPDETAAAIRAGASDMLLAEAPDADLVTKVRRLLRRGRR